MYNELKLEYYINLHLTKEQKKDQQDVAVTGLDLPVTPACRNLTF